MRLNHNLILFVFVLLKFILQFIIVDPVYELHRDEFLHLDQGDHLAWGYLSVPPFSSWIAVLIRVLGNGEFWIRFFPALFGALTLIVVWKTVELFNGTLFAKILAALSIIFSVLLRMNILFQPNSFDILAWTFTYYALLRYLITGSPTWIYVCASALGIGMLNKYNILFLLPGVAIGILFSEHRKILASKHFYYAIILFLLIISPNLFWQWKHGFPVVRHMQELSTTQLKNVDRFDFIKEQVLYFLGSLFVLIASLIALWRTRPLQPARFMFWSFFITLAIFIYLRAKGYYAIGLYPVYLAIGATWIGMLLNNKSLFAKVLVAAIPVVLSIPLFYFAFPNRSPQEIYENPGMYKKLGLLRWEDGKEHMLPQDFADMQGWKELASKVDSIYRLQSGNTLVWCDNYGQAGAINHYSSIPKLEAYTLNADYIDWTPLDKPINNIILIQEASDTDPERKDERDLFQRIELTGEVTNPYAREKGTKIYLLQGAVKDINAILLDDIKKASWNQ